MANLRQIIGDATADPPYLSITHHDIMFNLSSNVWIDIETLSNMVGIEKATPDNIIRFKEVLDIYQGEFLTGFNLPDSLPFDEWALIKRDQYTRKMIAVLQQAGNYYEKIGEFESALPFAWRHVELEPWQEKARRKLMRLLLYTDRRDEALQQYLDLESSLQASLNIVPGAKTKQLYQSILEGKEGSLPEIVKIAGDEPIALPKFLQEEKLESLPPETFVARKDELERLRTHLDSMIEGQGNIVMISGEAGSGKTMLIREFIRQVQSRYPFLISATGYSNAFTGVGDPYLPFGEILYQLCGDIQTHWKRGAFSRQNALNLWNTIPITYQSLLTYGPDLIDTVIPGKSLLELVSPYSKTHSAWYTELEEHLRSMQQQPKSTVQQANLFSQIIAVLQKIADQVPLLLILDDLQWADISTIGILFQFVKQIPQSRIMLVGAYRSEEVGVIEEDERHPLIPVLHEVQRDFGDVLINLDNSQGKDFVRELIASEPNTLDDAFCEQLFDLTKGHALFTVELLRNMQESGALVRNERGEWVMQTSIQLEMLPPHTKAVIAQRISRLPQNLQRILKIASIEGEIFTAENIAAVEESSVIRVVSLLSDKLDKQHRLVRSQQISWQGDQSISTYRFRHFLFQKYLYDSLDEIERVHYHDRVGCEMEAIVGDNKTQYAVSLARHFHKANQIEKALTYYSLAGERAVRMSAYPEAITQFEAALALLLTLPETPARNEQEIDLQLQLGLAYQTTVGFAHEKVGASYQRAWELCQMAGDPVKKITTIQLLFSYYSNMTKFETAEEMLALLQQSMDDLEEPVSAFDLQLHWGNGYLDSLYGNHNAALDRFEHALTYYNPATHYSISERVGMEAGIYCHGWGGLHAAYCGYPEKAKAHIQSAFEIAERYNSKLFTTDALWFSTWISLELEDIAAAKKYVEALLKLTTQEHYFLFEAVARTFRGRILFRDGKHKEAIASAQRGLEMFNLTGMVATKILYLHALAEAYCAAGHVREGLEIVMKAEHEEQETGEIRQKASLQRIKGDLHLLGGNEIAAEEAYLAAVATAQEQSAKLLELEAAKRLASLWNRQGKREQAREMLQEVYDWFTEGFDTSMLVEARELLAELADTKEMG
ncbi:MAG: AAA family ATPase [Anaerolineales bacterium]